MSDRTKEEWEILAAKELAIAEDICDGSLGNWKVVRNGRQYQVTEGGKVIQSNNSIWKLKQWLYENVDYPWAKPEPWEARRNPDSGAIARHYEALHVPIHETDTEDYSLTDEEKAEIHQSAIAFSEEGISALESLLTENHRLLIDGEYTATTVKDLSIVEVDTGEVLKQGTAPWQLKLWYEKMVLKTW